MPWTIADVEKHKQGLTDKQKSQWVAIANDVLEQCLADGGTDETCAPKAIRQANGSVGGKSVELDETSDELKSLDDLLISYGSAVKALGDGKIAGYLVLFSNEDAPDLEGEFFSKETDFDLIEGERSAVYYQHGFDPVLKRRKLGDATLKIDDIGVWMDGQLSLRDNYERMIYNLTEQGKLGLSSGTAPHLVEKEAQEGKAVWIKRWPLGLDATLTPTPAEPRTKVQTLKAYKATLAVEPEADPPQGASTQQDASADAAKSAGKATKSKRKVKGGIMKPFKIKEKWYLYDTDENGERAGDPQGAYDTEKDALDHIAKNAPLTVTPKVLSDMVSSGVAEAMKTVMASLSGSDERKSRALTSAVPAQVKRRGRGHLDEEWKTYLKAILGNDGQTLENMGCKSVKYSKELSSSVGASGGFTVFPQFLEELIEVPLEGEIAWNRADYTRMDSPSMHVPGLDTSGTTPGETHMLPGFKGAWTESGEQKHETDIDFTDIELKAYEYSGWIDVKDSLIMDSFASVPGLISKLARKAVGYYRDEAVMEGTGAGQPQGVVAAPGTLVIPRIAAGGVCYEDLVNMCAALLPSSLGNARWIFNHTLFKSLHMMRDPAGQYIWAANAIVGQPTRVIDHEWNYTEKTPTLGNQGDVILADWSWYYAGDRQEYSFASSEHVHFLQNRTVFRFVMRVDGQEKLKSPIFLKDGETLVSPFVVLGGPAT